MEKREYHIGPGAASLILVAVTVSMAVIGLLAVLEVRGDMRLTERSTQLITEQYDASWQAELDLQALDAVLTEAMRSTQSDEAFFAMVEEKLPEGMTMDGSVVSWEREANDSSALSCAVIVSNSTGADRIRWIKHAYESHVGEIDME